MTDLPEGATYVPDFVSPDEERSLPATIEALDPGDQEAALLGHVPHAQAGVGLATPPAAG